MSRPITQTTTGTKTTPTRGTAVHPELVRHMQAQWPAVPSSSVLQPSDQPGSGISLAPHFESGRDYRTIDLSEVPFPDPLRRQQPQVTRPPPTRGTAVNPELLRHIQAQWPAVPPPLPPPGAPPPGAPSSSGPLFPRERVPLFAHRLEFPERIRELIGQQPPSRYNIASTDGVGISGLTDAENDFVRLPPRGTSVPAHPPVPPSIPGGVNQYPQLFIPPDVQPATPTRQRRGRSQPPPQQEPPIDLITRSTSRSRNHGTQPVQIIDMQPNQEPEI